MKGLKGFPIGVLHPRWKGGRYITTQGYVRMQRPDHPRADKNGYVFEHLIVAEEKLGRRLVQNELVHHINECRSDNRPDNIEVMTKKQHQQHHMGLNGRPSKRRRRFCDCGTRIRSRHLTVTKCVACGLQDRSSRLPLSRCTFSGCTASHRGKEYCRKHYRLMWWRNNVQGRQVSRAL